MNSVKRREIKSFVKRKGRMSKLQINALRNLSGIFSIPFQEKLISFHKIFQNKNNTFLEIGFGMGQATVEIAEKTPDKNYIGIEVHTPGVGKLLSEIELRELKNIRVIEYDAVEVIHHMIPDNSLQGVHIFFPDPWPKKKHHKRRLIKDSFIRLLIPKIKDEGYLYIATDWEPYAEWIVETLGRFNELANKYDLYAEHIPWRPVTAFEKKGKNKNHLIRDIWFDKKKTGL